MKPIFSIGWQDVLKGFLISVAGSFLTAVAAYFKEGRLPTLGELGTIGLIALSVGISYIVMNFFTNSSGQLAKGEK
jgi:hypothetical protein